jgi:predicted AAA+ superfamily ATPase
MERGKLVALALTRLRNNPVVALLGPRQVGKTTLAAQIAAAWRGPTTRFDLENPEQVRRFDEPMAILEPLRGLVVLDEIQRRPELFPALRVLADRPKKPARFLVLGSASPELLRQTSESLAGRIHYVTIDGFALDEVGESRLDRLWLRGGFPRSFLARSDAESFRWRRDFIQTFLERDLAQLGFRTPADTLFRFWTMLAHYHGQIWNASEFGRAFGVSDVTVRHYLDVLAATLVVRVLQPWHQNIAKRQVKAPKIYISDSGLVHALLNLPTRDDLVVHPKVGASWEGFILGQLVRRLGVRPEECHFWGTQQGAELDLLVVRGRRRLGFEIKHSRAPAVSRSMLIAGEDLRLDSVDVIHSGTDTYMLRKGVRAVAARRLLEDVKPVGA